MDTEQTTPLSTRIRYQLSQLWLATLTALYELSPVQRLVVVTGILLFIPAYWGARYATYGILTSQYYKTQLVARPSFTNPVAVQSSPPQLVRLVDGGYAALVNFANPNSELAVDKAEIEFTAQDSSGANVYAYRSTFFLLPGQRREFVVPYFKPPVSITGATVQVRNAHYQKRFEIPTIDIVAERPTTRVMEDGSESVDGTVVNQSPYTLHEILISYKFLDDSGKVVGLVERLERDVKPAERRVFPLDLRGIEISSVQDVKTSVFSNPLDARNLVAGVSR